MFMTQLDSYAAGQKFLRSLLVESVQRAPQQVSNRYLEESALINGGSKWTVASRLDCKTTSSAIIRTTPRMLCPFVVRGWQRKHATVNYVLTILHIACLNTMSLLCRNDETWLSCQPWVVGQGVSKTKQCQPTTKLEAEELPTIICRAWSPI